MKFVISKEMLLIPLKKVSVFVNTNLKLSILSNILLKLSNNFLELIGSNLETEIIAKLPLINIYSEGITTVSGRKFLNICKNLPPKSNITILLDNNRLLIQSEKVRFFLSTLPYKSFPFFSTLNVFKEFFITEYNLKCLIEFTQFAIAQDDARFFLNGMLLKICNNKIQAVSSNGHRLAISSIKLDFNIIHSIIIPKKNVIELYKILNFSENLIKIHIYKNKIRVFLHEYIFTSKLIESNFPSFQHIISKHIALKLEIDSNLLKNALFRVNIINSKDFLSVKLTISNNQLKISTSNSESEEAQEIIDIVYNGNTIIMSLNSSYLIDILNVLKCKKIFLYFVDNFSSIQIHDSGNIDNLYVIMPIDN